MVLTSWLPIQNQAIRRADGTPITSQDLANDTTPEAKSVNLFWDKALEKVLSDHNWSIATKSLLLGTSTTEETPVTPVGVTELASADTVRKYYMPVPAYDATGLIAGTVNFEIVRVIENSYIADWVPEQNRIYFYNAITDVNVYVSVIFKVGFADAGRSNLFCDALVLKLAQLIAKPTTGKDNQRDAILQAEYNAAIAEARMRDNTNGDPAQDGNRTWFDAATGTRGLTEIWTDTAGLIHSEP